MWTRTEIVDRLLELIFLLMLTEILVYPFWRKFVIAPIQKAAHRFRKRFLLTRRETEAPNVLRLRDKDRLCIEVALACVLRMPVEAVPDLDIHGKPYLWLEKLDSWLDALGWDLYVTEFEDPVYPCIATGPSPRYDEQRHAVVWFKGGVLWDPHSSEDGIVEEDMTFYILRKRKVT